MAYDTKMRFPIVTTMNGRGTSRRTVVWRQSISKTNIYQSATALTLLSQYCHGAGVLNLLGFLDQSAEVAEQDHQQVLAAASRDAGRLADASTYADQRDDVDHRDEVEETADAARLADSLSALAEGVARNEVSDDAESHVVEASTGAVFPASRHDAVGCG